MDLDVEYVMPPYTLRQPSIDRWTIKHRDGRLYVAQVVNGKLAYLHYGRMGLSMKRTGFTWQPVKEGKPTWRALDAALRHVGAYAPRAYPQET